MRRYLSLGIFALIVVSAPLGFGAVDRSFQAILAGLLAVGMFLAPPSLPLCGKWTFRFSICMGFLLVAKEFLPHQLFGPSHWRLVLTDGLALPLSWMHNPEPARAFDSLLVALIALVWFLWVRSLSAVRENRQIIAWSLFVSAATLAAVCLFMPKGALIYGFRSAPGWMGFGPFPNRNHTASFLAMGLLVGLGCCVHAARRKRFPSLGCGLLLLGLIFLTLIESKSRGAIGACAVGLAFYSVMAVAMGRNRKTLAVVGAAALTGFGLFMAFGAGLIARFSAGGDLPTNLRWDIWRDAIGMWKEAPLLGHGIGAFAQVFPIYQNVALENQIVLHPESSWLLWLAEFGLLPVAAVFLGVLWLLGCGLKEAFVKRRGFLAHAAIFGAVVTMLAHCCWDVPGHRWATAGFALAALALACPLRTQSNDPNPAGILRFNAAVDPGMDPNPPASSSLLALLPLALCLFWAIPFCVNGPPFSPTTVSRLMQRIDRAPAREVQAALSYFPLDPELHQAMGMRWLNSGVSPGGASLAQAKAWKHFQVADRLRPGSWSMPASQAMAAQEVSPGMALYFWTLAIERAGHRNTEIFLMAYRHTLSLPIAPSFWARYAETNPELLLSYAQQLPDDEAKIYYGKWVEARSQTDRLGAEEVALFYAFAARFGDRAQFIQWMEQHPSREKTDFRDWSGLLHQWGDDATAWKLLSSRIKDPAWPHALLSSRTEALEVNWLKDPASVVNAQALADAYQRVGDAEGCKKVILSSAKQKNAPPWFLQKAAFLLAAENRLGEAVTTLLRIPSQTAESDPNGR